MNTSMDYLEKVMAPHLNILLGAPYQQHPPPPHLLLFAPVQWRCCQVCLVSPDSKANLDLLLEGGGEGRGGVIRHYREYASS